MKKHCGRALYEYYGKTLWESTVGEHYASIMEEHCGKALGSTMEEH